jgi:hypothetical protein
VFQINKMFRETYMRRRRIMLIGAVLASGMINSCAEVTEQNKQNKRFYTVLSDHKKPIGVAVSVIGLALGVYFKGDNLIEAIPDEHFGKLMDGVMTLYDGAKSAVPGMVMSGPLYVYVRGVGNKEAAVVSSATAGLTALCANCEGYEKGAAFVAAGLTATSSYVANKYIAQVLPKHGNKIKNNGLDYRPGLNWSREKGVTLTL